MRVIRLSIARSSLEDYSERGTKKRENFEQGKPTNSKRIEPRPLEPSRVMLRFLCIEDPLLRLERRLSGEQVFVARREQN